MDVKENQTSATFISFYSTIENLHICSSESDGLQGRSAGSLYKLQKCRNVAIFVNTAIP